MTIRDWIFAVVVGLAFWALIFGVALADEHECVDDEGTAGVYNVDGTCVTPEVYAEMFSPAALEQAAQELEALGYQRDADQLRLSASLAHPNPLRRDTAGGGTVAEFLFDISPDDPVLEIWDVPRYDPEQGVEQWRWLVEQHYPDHRVQQALAVMDCESGGDPTADNPRSSARGLMQFIRDTWNRHADALGFEPYGSGDVYDPAKNIEAAAYLGQYYETRGLWWWDAWSCKRVLR